MADDEHPRPPIHWTLPAALVLIALALASPVLLLAWALYQLD